MSGHADGYSQADREKDTMTPAKQALRMSGHADPIRRAIMCSLYNTGRIIEGKPYSHDDYDAAHAALDALRAENQRLREVVDALLPASGCTTVEEALKALAGDTE